MRRPSGHRCHLLAAIALILAPAAATADGPSVDAPSIVFRGVPLEVRVTVPEGATAVTVEVDGKVVRSVSIEPGEHTLTLDTVRLDTGVHEVAIVGNGERATDSVRAIPGWWSILPPLLAIGLALAFKDVLLSLYLGIFLGALITVGGNPFVAFGRSIDTFVKGALEDDGRVAILIFTLLLGGMVGVISRSGGTQGIVNRISRFATSVRRGQATTWMLGMVVFFDDYANTLIVGPTMRPITDRLKISREKLAYIVDSTAAPIASIVPISTWVGYEVGLIAAAFTAVGLDLNPYTTFVHTIPYRFYPIFALVMVFLVAVMGRDLGPMLRAEQRAQTTGEVIADGDTALADYGSRELAPAEGTVPKALNALIPIVTVVTVTVFGLVVTGRNAIAGLDVTGWVRVRETFSNADSYTALLWASLSGAVAAILLARLQAGLPLKGCMEALLSGFKAMLLAIVVLILAWSLGDVTAELQTANFIVGLTEGALPPTFLPALVFVVAAGVAFATGTSWATMAILIPLVVPVMHRLAEGAGHAAGTDAHYTLLLGAISSVLAGSVWGDHCSPISDTTILSSMASGCDHIAHVRTQMPYAVSLGLLGIVVGDIPTAFGMSPWLSLVIGILVIAAVVRWVGRPVDEGTA